MVVYLDDAPKFVMEHRWVMQQIIGRPLTHAERVHHLDGDRQNNDPTNLVLCADQGEHLRKYHPDLVKNLRKS